MVDFNPSAVARGIGNLKVALRSTFKGYPMEWLEVIASIPYVEVLNDRVFDAFIRDIILDEERMLIFSQARGGKEHTGLIPTDILPHKYHLVPRSTRIPNRSIPRHDMSGKKLPAII